MIQEKFLPRFGVFEQKIFVLSSLTDNKEIKSKAFKTFRESLLQAVPGSKTAKEAFASFPEIIQMNILQSMSWFLLFENFWKPINGRVVCRNFLAPTINGSPQKTLHGYGMAMDIDVTVGGESLPVNKVYAGFRRMTAKQIIPFGGLGLNINVEGIQTNIANQNIFKKESIGKCGKGGSGPVHWDWRGSFPSKRFGKIKISDLRYNPYVLEPRLWIQFNLLGKGQDQLATYRKPKSPNYPEGSWGATPYDPLKDLSGGFITAQQIKTLYPEIFDLVYQTGWKKVEGVPQI